MGLLIDGSLLLEHERGRVQLEGRALAHGGQPLFVSVITVAELLHAAQRALTPGGRALRSAFVEGVIASFPLLPIDLPTARAHARLMEELSGRAGRTGAADSWLAAAALAHGLTLVMGEPRGFREVLGLRVESWLSPGGERPSVG